MEVQCIIYPYSIKLSYDNIRINEIKIMPTIFLVQANVKVFSAVLEHA